MAVVAAVLTMGAGCGARSADPAPLDAAALPTVSVTHLRRGDVMRTVTLPGDLVGQSDSALYAKVTGYLKRIDVDKGDWVKRGQVLAEIEVPELEQRLKRARASLQVRRVTYDRLRGVWASDRRLVAREDVDIAEGEFQKAEADVEGLEALVGYTKIVAPFDGVVTARYVDLGALIRSSGHGGDDGGSSGGGGQGKEGPVLRLADISTLRVYVYVPEAETSLIRRGQPATLTLREFPGRTFTGTVARFNTSLALSTRTMLTEVDLDNTAHELYPGMYADVSVELVRHAGALQVPTASIGRADGAEFVRVVRDGVLQRAPVTTGLGAEGWVEITSGLSGDETLVANPDPGLTDGERVHTVDAGEAVEHPHAAG